MDDCVHVAGGLFGEGDEHRSVENAFRYAVYRINHDRQLLPDTRLGYDIQHVPVHDGFRASKKGRAVWSSFFVGMCVCVCVCVLSLIHI